MVAVSSVQVLLIFALAVLCCAPCDILVAAAGGGLGKRDSREKHVPGGKGRKGTSSNKRGEISLPSVGNLAHTVSISDPNAAVQVKSWIKDIYKNGGSATFSQAVNREREVVRKIESGEWSPAVYHEYQRIASVTGNVDSARLLLTYALEQTIAEHIQRQSHIGVIYAAMQTHCRSPSSRSEYGKDPVLDLLDDVQLLVNINSAVAEDGTTLLMAAAYFGCNRVVKSLLANDDVDVEAVGIHGLNALMVAALAGHGDVIDSLIVLGNSNVNVIHKFAGSTALHMAAELGRFDAIYSLCHHGINATAITSVGGNALHVAATSGASEKAIDALVGSSTTSSVSIGDMIDGEDILLQKKEVGEKLQENDQKKGGYKDEKNEPMKSSSISSSERSGSSGRSGGCGIDVNSLMNRDTTALYMAAQSGFVDTTRALLANGADPHFIMPATPYVGGRSLAKSKGRKGERGDDDDDYMDDDDDDVSYQPSPINNEIGNFGQALHAAAENGHSDIVEILIKEGGANVQSQSIGASPLHMAVQYLRTDVVHVLLDNGASVNEPAVTDAGTALYYAAGLVSRGMARMDDRLRNSNSNSNRDSSGDSKKEREEDDDDDNDNDDEEEKDQRRAKKKKISQQKKKAKAKTYLNPAVVIADLLLDAGASLQGAQHISGATPLMYAILTAPTEASYSSSSSSSSSTKTKNKKNNKSAAIAKSSSSSKFAEPTVPLPPHLEMIDLLVRRGGADVVNELIDPHTTRSNNNNNNNKLKLSTNALHVAIEQHRPDIVRHLLALGARTYPPLFFVVEEEVGNEEDNDTEKEIREGEGEEMNSCFIGSSECETAATDSSSLPSHDNHITLSSTLHHAAAVGDTATMDVLIEHYLHVVFGVFERQGETSTESSSSSSYRASSSKSASTSTIADPGPGIASSSSSTSQHRLFTHLSHIDYALNRQQTSNTIIFQKGKYFDVTQGYSVLHWAAVRVITGSSSTEGTGTGYQSMLTKLIRTASLLDKGAASTLHSNATSNTSCINCINATNPGTSVSTAKQLINQRSSLTFRHLHLNLRPRASSSFSPSVTAEEDTVLSLAHVEAVAVSALINDCTAFDWLYSGCGADALLLAIQQSSASASTSAGDSKDKSKSKSKKKNKSVVQAVYALLNAGANPDSVAIIPRVTTTTTTGSKSQKKIPKDNLVLYTPLLLAIDIGAAEVVQALLFPTADQTQKDTTETDSHSDVLITEHNIKGADPNKGLQSWAFASTASSATSTASSSSSSTSTSSSGTDSMTRAVKVEAMRDVLWAAGPCEEGNNDNVVSASSSGSNGSSGSWRSSGGSNIRTLGRSGSGGSASIMYAQDDKEKQKRRALGVLQASIENASFLLESTAAAAAGRGGGDGGSGIFERSPTAVGGLYQAPLLLAVVRGNRAGIVDALLKAGALCNILVATMKQPQNGRGEQKGNYNTDTLVDLARNRRDFDTLQVLSGYPRCDPEYVRNGGI